MSKKFKETTVHLLPAIDRGEWGPVLITSGPNKGRVGYWDDEGGEPGAQIVYLGIPLLSENITLTRDQFMVIEGMDEIYFQMFEKDRDDD